MAQLDLRHSHLGDRHHQRLQLRQCAAAQIEDWRLPDLPPDPIASPAAAALAIGDRLVELPGKPSERRGCFVGWGWHRQAGEMRPIVQWDDGTRSFTDLRIVTMENSMNTPHEKLDPVDRLRRECHFLIDKIAAKPYNLKLLSNAKNMMLLLLGYKGKRQSLRDRNPLR